MFELNEGVKLNLKNKITPGILKTMNSLGLLKEVDSVNMLSKLLDIYTDEEKLKSLIQTMFVLDENVKLDYDEIDLGILFEAFQVFFLKLVGK